MNSILIYDLTGHCNSPLNTHGAVLPRLHWSNCMSIASETKGYKWQSIKGKSISNFRAEGWKGAPTRPSLTPCGLSCPKVSQLTDRKERGELLHAHRLRTALLKHARDWLQVVLHLLRRMNTINHSRRLYPLWIYYSYCFEGCTFAFL